MQPWIFFSITNAAPCMVTISPGGIIPMMVAVPPFLSI